MVSVWIFREPEVTYPRVAAKGKGVRWAFPRNKASLNHRLLNKFTNRLTSLMIVANLVVEIIIIINDSILIYDYIVVKHKFKDFKYRIKIKIENLLINPPK